MTSDTLRFQLVGNPPARASTAFQRAEPLDPLDPALLANHLHDVDLARRYYFFS